MRRHVQVERLEDHPDAKEILEILARVTHISDSELIALAGAWADSPRLAAARDRALGVDSLLVCEVLSAFDALSGLYADDLAGGHDYISVDPQTTETALRAVRDAIAAGYARPVLSRREHRALSRPWRRVFAGAAPRRQPDLGPYGPQVARLLGAFGALAERCHDPAGAQRWEHLDNAALCQDAETHQAALQQAWQAAVACGSRRMWALVRRSAAEAFSRPCPRCRRRPQAGDLRVARLGMDAACALLVLPHLADPAAVALTEPVAQLVDLRPRTLD